MNWLETQIPKWVLGHRLLIIVAALVITAYCATGARHLYLDSSYKVFFSKDNPQLRAFEEMERTYNKTDNVLIVIAPKSRKVFTNDTLAIVEEMTNDAWQIPYSTRVDSLTNFQHTEAIDDDLQVANLVGDAHRLDAAQLARIQTIALSEPLLKGRLVSQSAHVTALNVTVQIPAAEQAAATPVVVNYIRAMVDRYRARHPDHDYYLTGMVVMNNSFSEQSVNDLTGVMPMSFAVMFGLLIILVGSFFGSLSTVVVIGASVAAAMGITGMLGFPITSASASAPTVILTVAIANCVHILISYYQGVQNGAQRLAAMEESLRVNFQPVTLASATTTIGFLTLNFSEVPPFRMLGTIVAIGVGFAYILSITLLPSLITLLPVKPKRRTPLNDILMERLAEFVIRRRRTLLFTMGAIIVTTIANIPRNELNDVFVHYFHPPLDFRTATDFTLDNLTGIYTINYSLKSADSGGVNDPEFLRDVEAFTSWARQRPETVHVHAFTDIMKRLNKNMHGDALQWYRLPGERDLAAQYLLLYEMSLPYGLDLNNQINIDKSGTKVSMTLRLVSSNELIAFDKQAKAWLEENASSVIDNDSAGTIAMFSNIGRRNIRAMLIGTTLALVLISILLIVALRSLRIGIISLIPNLVPAAVGFGLWGIFVGEVGIALSVVTSLTLGIVVDDTVHFLSKYLRAKRELGYNPEQSVRYAFKTVGRALLVTSTVLVIGFSILATSLFELNAGMGLLTAVVIAIALIADFLFLPPLLMKFEEDPDDAITDPSERRAAVA
ncbi:MAG: MMPL family transporter [Pseudomonadota bacterium]